MINHFNTFFFTFAGKFAIQIKLKTKNMKKLIVLLFVALFITGTFAQQIFDGNPFANKLPENSYVQSPLIVNSNPMNVPKRDIGDPHSIWINFPFTLNDYTGGQWTTYTQHMFPDTFVKIRYITTVPTPSPHYEFVYNYVRWNSIGLTLNPKSDYIGLPNLWDEQSYTVDSISFFYGYYRFSDPSVVDTLVIQVIKPDNLYPYTYTSTHLPAFSIPGYNRGINEAAKADFTQRIPLGAADTFTFAQQRWGIWSFPLSSFTISHGGPVAVVWTFKSGSKYGFGDTIPYAKWDSVQGVAKPLNMWFWAGYYDQSQEQLNEYNNGDLINFQHRYTDFSTNIASRYIPGSFWTNPLYPVALFKISYTEAEQPIGINNLGNEIKTKCYPNPVRASQNFNVQLNLTTEKNVLVELFDVMGHKVATMANSKLPAGESTVTMPAGNLSAGIYVCRISADNSSSSFRINVK